MCPSLAGLQRPRQSALRLGLQLRLVRAHEEHRSNDGRQANHGKRDTERPGHVRRAPMRAPRFDDIERWRPTVVRH